MTTSHQYLDKYPIAPNSERLIIGTIHPHHHESFLIPFFYGNVLSLWKILSDAYPLELKQPITLDGVLNFLKNRNIAMSDTICQCTRINPTALDKDLIPTRLNEKVIQDIRASTIKHIFFTSGFGKNNAFKLFYEDILGYRVSESIKSAREIIDKTTFGRPVKFTILYSPSPRSNMGISKSEIYLANKHKYAGSNGSVNRFKVDYYRYKFNEVTDW